MAGYASDPQWTHTGYHTTTSQLEQEYNRAQGLAHPQYTSNQNSYPVSGGQAASQPQSFQFDNNLWPSRSQPGYQRTQPYGQQPTSRSNSMQGYGQYDQSDSSGQLFHNPANTGSFSQQQQQQQQQQQHSISPQQRPQPLFQGNQESYVGYSTTSNITSTAQFSASPAMVQTPLPSMSGQPSPVSPPVGQTLFQGAPPPSRTSTGATDFGRPNNAKRPRGPEPDFSREEEVDMDELNEQPDEGTRIKPTGACARCKNLKVKCEFRTDTDPCKRCLNAGQECVIPGRKKRRTPPKREHLLNQIREQHEQIQKLMARLEETDKQRAQPNSSTSDTFSTHHRNKSSASLHSPVLSPTSPGFPGTNPTSPASETNKAVEDWISKARESLAEFGGFIGMGGSGSGIPKSYLIEKDLEDPSSSDDDGGYDDDGGDGGADSKMAEQSSTREEYDFAVVDSDGEESSWYDIKGKQPTKLSRASSTSSNHDPNRRRESGNNAKTKLATLPSEAVPFGLMAQLSLKNHRRSSEDVAQQEGDPDEEKQLGVANADFFRASPGPDPQRTRLSHSVNLPHILLRNIITIEEAEKLFKIYYDYINLSVSLLDPVLYTAQRTCFRSPFLFTVICAIAARFYPERPDLYPQAMHYAQLAAGTTLLSGPKTVEMCHGYLLLALYPVPARRWEEDRSWVFLGLAIRIAIDLNLHIPVTAQPKNENHAREMLNRTRCYLNLFNVDRSMGSQYGKHPVLPNSDYISNHSADWWKSSPFNMNHFDIQLCCYNEELRIGAKFREKIYSDPEHPTGLNKDIDFDKLCKETDDELQQVQDKWMALIYQTDMTDPQNVFRTGLLNLAFSYARMAVLSFGFQHAFDRNNADEMLLMRCVKAAKDVVNVLLEDIGRPEFRIFLRHGPDAQRVFVTFAAAFLVKLLQPKFTPYLRLEERLEIRRLVKSVADVLGSPEVAVDHQHGPKLYSRFLKGLLATPMARVEIDPQYLTRQRSGGPLSSSGSPSVRHAESIGSVYSTPSPEASALSPPPNQAALSFDNFADNGALDPFVAPSLSQQVEQNTLNVDSGMNAFFSPPLPFDPEILSSMQSITNPSVWQDNMLPGFNWMSTFQQNPGNNAEVSRTMYDQFGQPYP